jgi:hypothetical protein
MLCNFYDMHARAHTTHTHTHTHAHTKFTIVMMVCITQLGGLQVGHPYSKPMSLLVTNKASVFIFIVCVFLQSQSTSPAQTRSLLPLTYKFLTSFIRPWFMLFLLTQT